ncbi:hypothetical protein SKAU_G00148100 [Synaphobranchus kaupii]|uniref:Uncharacterized protein n=1 Tax=Synaphobranchus kaupii TaxID=118154 RepID=A0A9Q1FU01_SYNKA|nr:hypothetical protein SKAU_G00148100 [Synaphobranchus kaupii]
MTKAFPKHDDTATGGGTVGTAPCAVSSGIASAHSEPTDRRFISVPCQSHASRFPVTSPHRNLHSAPSFPSALTGI